MKISGEVCSNARPVADARIRLRVGDEDLAQVSSDNNGKYEHKDSSNHIGQNLICRVEKNGYETKELSLPIERDPIALNIELVQMRKSHAEEDKSSWFNKVMEYKAILGIAILLAVIVIGWLISEQQPSGPQVVEFSVDPKNITKNQSTVVKWQTKGATEVTLNGKDVEPSGSSTEKPTATTTYTLKAKGKQNSEDSKTQTVTVKVPLGPRISSFCASPQALGSGGGTTILQWTTSNAKEVTIAPLPEKFDVTGKKEVPVKETTKFVLMAKNERGETVEQAIDVTVYIAPPQKRDPVTGRPVIGSLGRLKPKGETEIDRSPSAICDAARRARERNSPAAPALDAQCRAVNPPCS